MGNINSFLNLEDELNTIQYDINDLLHEINEEQNKENLEIIISELEIIKHQLDLIRERASQKYQPNLLTLCKIKISLCDRIINKII